MFFTGLRSNCEAETKSVDPAISDNRSGPRAISDGWIIATVENQQKQKFFWRQMASNYKTLNSTAPLKCPISNTAFQTCGSVSPATTCIWGVPLIPAQRKPASDLWSGFRCWCLYETCWPSCKDSSYEAKITSHI
jgi:hypothetical protein